jgi:hypothetical protein
LVALDLAVALGGAGRDPALLDAALGEQVAQRAVVDVGPRVVGLQAPWRDAVGGEERQGACDEAGNGLGALVRMQLGVDQAGMVVDDRVAELPANTGFLLGAGGRAIPGDPVPGAGKAREALGVHLQQIARAGPLEPADLLARPRRPARYAAPSQATADRGVRHPELGRDQPGPPARPLASLADPVMDRVADPAGLAMRRRGPVLRPPARGPLGLTRLPVALDPVLHRRDAHPSPARRFAARHPPIKTKGDQLDTLPRRQPPTLALHPG